jgi:hypothetical protein
MARTIHRNWAYIQSPFSAYGTQLKERKQSTSFEGAKNSGLEKVLIFEVCICT